MKPEDKVVCQQCRKAMPHARKNKKFCSDSCRAKHRREALNVTLAPNVAPRHAFAIPYPTTSKQSDHQLEAGCPAAHGFAVGISRQSNKALSRVSREIGAADLLLEPSETFTLNGTLGEFMGELDSCGTAIAIMGDEGGGRTTFALMLASKLARAGMRVKYLSLQEGLGWSFKAKVKQVGIGNAVEFVDWADLGAIRRAARLFDAVVIDTYSSLRLSGGEIARLKADFPRTVFVCVHLRRKDGELVGGMLNRLSSSAVVELVRDRQRGLLAVMRKSHGGMMGYGLGLDDGGLYLPGEMIGCTKITAYIH